MFQSIKYSLSTTTAEWLDNRGTDDDDDKTADRASKKAKKSKSKKSKRKRDEE